MVRIRLSSRMLALAAVMLAVVGLLLVFDGGESRTPTTAQPDPSANATRIPSAPESHWSPGQEEHHSHSPLSPWPDQRETPSPTAPSTAPGEEGGPQAESPPDPHVHHVPSAAEAAAAPPPEFTHEFNTEVPRDLANHLVNLSWRWLRPRLEADGWAHLKLIKHGVLQEVNEGGRAMVVAVELGHSGATGLGPVGVGKITTVWLEFKADDKWHVIGLKDGALRDG